MPAIVLHQWSISPFCGKVRRILEHKGLPYEIVNYNGLLSRKAAGLSKAGKLPVLDYDGERIQDSSDIAAFLEAKHPERPIFPADPDLRAQAQIWEDWADESLFWFEAHQRFMYPEARERAAAALTEGRPAFERVLMKGAVKRIYGKRLKAQGLGRLGTERVEQRLLGHVDTLETLLGRRTWLVGDARSIADIAVASQLAEIVSGSHLAPQIARREKVMAWLARN
ncbi:MAG TPA: glutathione S-transferase family protein [Kofleriaceae bacterium]|nr:glutathione S-transferase family protein [Kofleriaceae bacterium]